MSAVTRNPVTSTFFKVHPWIYRQSGGRLLGKIGPSPILMLTTRGRRSGEPRTNGLVYLDRGDSWAVAASWAGEPKHPIWYLNLMADPDVTIQVGNREVEVWARRLDGAEREAVWKDIVSQDPSFAEYERRTKDIREIPVVVFEPKEKREPGEYTLYGLSCSYFTGKLEAYFQAKGVPFHFVEMDRGMFRRAASATGVAQLPCVQTPQGEWLTDTTEIIAHFERTYDSGPALQPSNEAPAFLSYLLEDLFDEWYWRPALYYRWAFDDDARLMSSKLAKTLLRDVPIPLWFRQQLVLHRQRIVYLKKDGVTPKTSPAVEALYEDSLEALNEIFKKRPFLFGDKPCEADFGLFGPFFRHFFCDPTPGALMREKAPHLAQWVTRLWAVRSDDLETAGEITEIPDDLGFFFDLVAEDYLPYLVANADAYAEGLDTVVYEAKGVSWELPTAPYRVECLNELKQRFMSLDAHAMEAVRNVLPESAVEVLMSPATNTTKPADSKVRPGRLGRPAAMFD